MPARERPPVVSAIEGKKASLRILAMNLDTATPPGRLMLNVIGSVAQFEREMMLERQREGIAKAKGEGRADRPGQGRRRRHRRGDRQAAWDRRGVGLPRAEGGVSLSAAIYAPRARTKTPGTAQVLARARACGRCLHDERQGLRSSMESL